LVLGEICSFDKQNCMMKSPPLMAAAAGVKRKVNDEAN
jgi:hypothetical protein